MNTTPIRAFVLVTMAAAALPLHAAAQPSGAEGAEQIDELRRESRGRIGPIYFTPKLMLKEFGVDSNLFNASGEKNSDFTTTVSPIVDFWIPVQRRALFHVTAAPDLVWYATHSGERSMNPEFDGRTELYLDRLTLFATGKYINTRERPNYEIDLRARHVERGGSAGFTLSLTPRLLFDTAVRIDEREFDTGAHFDGVELQRVLNQKTTGISMAAKHRLTPLTTLVARLERSRDEFAYVPARDSHSFRAMSGVEFKPLALISGHAYVGYRRFAPAAAGALPEFSGVVARLGLSYTLLDATTFGVSYSRDLAYSYEPQQPYFVNDALGASVRRAIGSRFDVLVSADRHRYSYRDLLVSADVRGTAKPAVRRNDTTTSYAASLGYRIGEGRLAVGLSYWERQSLTKSYRNYDNVRFNTTMTYGF